MPKACKILLLLLAVIFVSSQSMAAENSMAQWHGSARIENMGNRHYNAFFLNELVYKNSRPDLADLRIVDQNDRFVPYFIINGYGIEQENKTIYHSQLVKQFKKGGNTTFDFQVTPLLKTADIMGNQLKLALPEQNFLKKVQIYGSYDGTTWESISSDQLYRVDGLIKNQIILGDIEKYTYYRVIVLNNTDNISLQSLQLINANLKKDWSVFQKTSRLNYKIINKSDNTIVTLYNLYHVKVKQISLYLTGNFRREYQVFNNPEMNNAIQTGEIYNLKFQDLNISETVIDLTDNPCSSSIIKIKIFNHDNQPLQINNIQTFYYLYQVVFEDLGAQNYHLYFGNPEAQKPVYDLETFKSHILNEPMNLVNLQDFKIAKTKVPIIKSKVNLTLIFNIVIIAITLLLIIFLVTKLNSQKP